MNYLPIQMLSCSHPIGFSYSLYNIETNKVSKLMEITNSSWFKLSDGKIVKLEVSI